MANTFRNVSIYSKIHMHDWKANLRDWFDTSRFKIPQFLTAQDRIYWLVWNLTCAIFSVVKHVMTNAYAMDSE